MQCFSTISESFLLILIHSRPDNRITSQDRAARPAEFQRFYPLDRAGHKRWHISVGEVPLLVEAPDLNRNICENLLTLIYGVEIPAVELGKFRCEQNV